jgi:hypothetical protein
MNPPVAQPPPLEAPLPETLDLKSLFEALLRRPQATACGGKPRCYRPLRPDGVSFNIAVRFCPWVLCQARPALGSSGEDHVGIVALRGDLFPEPLHFSTLAGARVGISQLAACFVGALALAGLLLLGFAPAVWIFAESTDSLGFMGTLAVGAWIIAVLFALRFLKSVVFATGGTQKGPLFIWSVVFFLVTLQMTTSLRPILGRSDVLLTQEKKFFLQHWADTFGTSLKQTAVAAAPTVPAVESTSEEGARNPYVR